MLNLLRCPGWPPPTVFPSLWLLTLPDVAPAELGGAVEGRSVEGSGRELNCEGEEGPEEELEGDPEGASCSDEADFSDGYTSRNGVSDWVVWSVVVLASASFPGS